jgi:isorenieratene synthase
MERALARALARPSGGWYVAGASAEFAATGVNPELYRIDGRELVAWRSGGRVHFAPNECPHMGASLAKGCVRDEALVCPWHGLRLSAAGHGRWRPLPVHDDGVLTWVRLDTGEVATNGPILPPRPQSFVASVVRVEADCDPRDVLANRLDPWHGTHYHPHTFVRLAVTSMTEDEIAVRVTYRIVGPLAIEVDAVFCSPEPRTIVMTITGGEGIGSVVETHATPMAPGRTVVHEALLATSDRPGFQYALRTARVVSFFMQKAAGRLWADDVAYAERLYALRSRSATGLQAWPASRPDPGEVSAVRLRK